MSYKIKFFSNDFKYKIFKLYANKYLGFHNRDLEVIYINLKKMNQICNMTNTEFIDLFTETITHEYIHKILWDIHINSKLFDNIDKKDLNKWQTNTLSLTICGYKEK